MRPALVLKVAVLLENILILFASFVVILIGSELFTNGIEWMGEKLGVAEAAVGSLFAAVGTALPETFIPMVALLMGRSDGGAQSAVGVGAIVGAPLMLSTVALFVMGVASLAYRKRRRRIALRVSREDARRDLSFFIPVFLTLIILGSGKLGPNLRYLTAACLLLVYCTYSFVMLRIRRSPDDAVEHGLYLELLFGRDPLRPRSFHITVQVLAGVAAILLGAVEFVDHLVRVAQTLQLNPGVLSLILSPLATELPEKYNSVVWIRRRKDHLALANITGAMVFQSCIPVALGVAFTPWHLSTAEFLAGGVGLGSSVLLYFNLRDGELGTPTLMAGGVAYAVFVTGLVILGVF